MKIIAHNPEHVIINDTPFIEGIALAVFTLSLLTVSIVSLFQQKYHRALWTTLGVTGSLALAGVLKAVSFDFDLAQQELSWKKCGLFRRSAGRLHFDEIDEIFLEANRVSRGDKQLAYVIYLKLKDGSYFQLSNTLLRRPIVDKIDAAIRQALSKEPKDALEENIIAALNAGSDIKALQLIQQQYRLDLNAAGQHLERLKNEMRHK